MSQVLSAATLAAVTAPVQDLLPDLVAHDLDGEARLVPVEDGAMHEQTGRFVYHDEKFVAIEDQQGFGRQALAWRRIHAGNSPSM